MKILFIHDRGFNYGGGEVYVLNLKKELENKHHTVKILTSDVNKNSSKLFSDYTFKGSENNILKWIFQIYNPWSFFKLKKVLNEYKPDVVHLQGVWEQTSPSILPLLREIPTILHLHDNNLIHPGVKHFFSHPCTNFQGKPCRKCSSLKGYIHFLIKDILRKRYISNIDIFITVNERTKNILLKKDLKSVLKINYGINILKRNLNKKNNNKINNILYVGRLTEEKGVKYLIEAVSIIIKILPKSRLTIAGTGPEFKKLESLSVRLGLKEDISFAGFCDNFLIKKRYEECDVLIVPSIYQEPFGLIGPEAMSLGKPVIASNVGGIPEWLDDGETGFLVDPGNPEQIAEKAIKLLSDRNLLKQMGKNARKKAEQFSIEKHADKIEKIYEELIEKYKTIEASL